MRLIASRVSAVSRISVPSAHDLTPMFLSPPEPREFAKTDGFSVGTHGSDSRFSGEWARVHDEPGVRDRLQGSVGAVVTGKGVSGGFGDIGSGAGDA